MNFFHQNLCIIPREINENAEYQNVFILFRDPSSIQILWKSLKEFLCKPTDQPTNKQMDTDENTTYLV